MTIRTGRSAIKLCQRASATRRSYFWQEMTLPDLTR
ncbi:hypothetical protein MYIN104542_00565 [Mycobacterium intermedium]